MTRSSRYVAVIADMVRSRDLPSEKRRALQKQLNALLVGLNRSYRAAIAAKFVVTLGDEFQGLLVSAGVIPDLIWDLEQNFEHELRVGIGFGTLDTDLQEDAINIDGPVLHLARTAIEDAKKSRAMGGVFRGAGDLDDILNGIARILWFHRFRWTPSQRKIANLLRQGMSQTETARSLRVTRQVVSKQVISAGCVPYLNAEKAWQMMFQKYVDPLIGSKHVLPQSH